MNIGLSLNIVGLMLITCGGIAGALSAPTPQYNPDGSVSLASSSESNKRIAIHKRQKLFPFFLGAVGLGACLQASSLFVPVTTVVSMPTLASFLPSLPDVVWSGIIGAILALSGVLLSNRGNTSRLRIQLQHDAAEKTKERTAALRRDVYLRALEELTKANAHLAGLPNLDPTKVNIGDGLQGFFSAAARLQLVGEPKTALLLNRLASEYAELFFELMVQLQPAHAARSDIQVAEHHYTLARDEVSRILSDMAKLNESGKPDPAVFRALQSNFDFQQGQSEKFAADRDAGWTHFNAANIAFQRMLLGKLRDLAPRQIPVMLELRRDLGLGGELDELESQMRQQVQRLEERFNALIATLEDS